MEAKYFLKRMGVIAGAVTVLATAHLAIHFQANEIARSVMSQYVPMTASELDAATSSKGKCKLDTDFGHGYSCHPGDKDWEREKAQIAKYHRMDWEDKELEQGETRIQVALGIFFGIGYAILLLMMLSSLRKLFSTGLAATIRKRISNLKRTAIGSSGGLREAMDRRQLHQAQKELLSLKSLYENGVIPEEVFVKRKAALAARLAITSR